MSKNRLFNIEYSALQGCYWMCFSVMVSFAAVFLQARGYSNLELGIIMAAGNIAAAVLQPVVAGIADRSRRRSLVDIIFLIVLIMPIFQVVNLLHPGRGPVVAVCYAAFLCGINLIQPLVNAAAGYLEAQGTRINFGFARGIGSVCFALQMALMGILVERVSAEVLPVSTIAVCLLMLCVLLLLRRQTDPALAAARVKKEESRSATEFLRSDKKFALLLVGLALTYFSPAVISSFFINIVENVGGNNADMGVLNAYTALLELPVMFCFAWILRRVKGSRLFRLSILMFAIKAFAVYLSPNIGSLYAAQFLQMLSFGLYIPASVNYVSEFVAPADQAKGQAFITSMVCISSIFASLLGGAMFDSLGVETTLLVSALISSLGAIIALPAIKTSK